MGLHSAFLVLQEHPYGREMLRILLERGYTPGLVVEEVSPVAEEERAKFLARIAGQPMPLTITSLIAGRDIPRHTVSNQNDSGCQELLSASAPDLLVLGGTRIIDPRILTIPPRGTVNAHLGLLPRPRGSSSVGWALYKDLPVGATTHFVDPGIDTGPILLQRRLSVRRGNSYERIVRRVMPLAGELMAETLADLAAGPVQALPQDPSAGETLRVIPPELLQEVKRRLEEGRYSHFER